MDVLAELIDSSEDWLVARVLEHAKRHDYTRYTSTLMEAWRASIVGLSEAIAAAARTSDGPPELAPDDDYAADPVAAFGILEAQKHRSRGITLPMFLGLMKYYRQSYVDLVAAASLSPADRERCRLFLDRCFDRIEIGFCEEWNARSAQAQLEELRNANRNVTNEKNRYLTIFESLDAPVVLLDDRHQVVNMNRAAAMTFLGREVPGSGYYGESTVGEALSWLEGESGRLGRGDSRHRELERRVATPEGLRFFRVQLQSLLDVSEKFQGNVAIFEDLTERRRLEDELRIQSTRDELTGLYNRRGFFMLAQDRVRLARRSGQAQWLFYADLDDLKGINDRLGHQLGDLALVDVSRALTRTFRESDIVSRFGGDEFVVLAGSGSASTPDTTLDRLHVHLQEGSEGESRPYRLSVSTGVVSLDPASALKLEEVLSRADEAMYARKVRQRAETQTRPPESLQGLDA
jgi:diguanylate cyclase (GGDEF)-like protein/PAS domain S-box-containing protein